jgi:(1->4)-alpha-D-glucan 1-alpha-D-glucosylmutase
VLERGELQVEFADGALVVRYFDHALPVNPRQAPRVYSSAIDPLTLELGQDSPHLHEFLSIVSSLQHMPAYTERDPARIAERQREKEVARTRLARLVTESPAVKKAIDDAVRRVNGTPGNAATFDALHDLLESQAYRLSYWRTASEEINYRRFFDINTLAGLRVEDPLVFEATHQLLEQLLREGSVHAVRVDHPDGLFDPQRYFEMLQDLAAQAWNIERTANERPLYVLAEKILSGREVLPESWAVHGTTGYNYLNDLNGLFVDAAQARRMRRVYSKLTGRNESFEDVLYETKRLIMNTAMASELNVLSHMFDRIGESNWKSRDFTLESLRSVIVEVVACFPVYRTYVDQHGWTTADRRVVEQAVLRARRRNPAMESSLFDFFREVVLPRDPQDLAPGGERRSGYPPANEDEARNRQRFAMKLQQYTGPVQAKGLEDTAFYRYNVLLSLNEVGGDPSRFGRAVQEFHDANTRRSKDWPLEMLATATHDTKLGEDVRARVNVLSELPDEWGREVSKWMRANRAHRSLVDGDPAPDRNDEYRFYQVLVGAWPLDLAGDVTEAPAELVERFTTYMGKAVKEAKLHTSWLTPNQAYEDALSVFIQKSLTGAGGARFLPLFLPFQRRIAALGAMNSLAQVTLTLGSPGVPDFYQGTELWDLSLVDPDNRRPVDFELRSRLLDEVEAVLALEPSARAVELSSWVENWQDGRIKLAATVAGLRLRQEFPDLFLHGGYLPLATEMTVKGGAVAFARTGPGDQVVLFAAPRLIASLAGSESPAPLGGEHWRTSRVMLPQSLRDRTFRHALTGAEIRPTRHNDSAWIFLGEIFQHVPGGMLITNH